MSNRAIDSLKFAVFNEWSYDPPAGGMTIYYAVYGTAYDVLRSPISEIYDHLSDILFDDTEIDELEEAYNEAIADENAIQHFSWDNGGLGCGCDVFAEGEDIAQVAADFFYDNLADWFDEDEAAEAEREAIIQNAIDQPNDYFAVIDLLEMIIGAIEMKNDAMY